MAGSAIRSGSKGRGFEPAFNQVIPVARTCLFILWCESQWRCESSGAHAAQSFQSHPVYAVALSLNIAILVNNNNSIARALRCEKLLRFLAISAPTSLCALTLRRQAISCDEVGRTGIAES